MPLPWSALSRVAALLHERNAIDVELARLIHRPMTSGHLGEWIAAQVFGIELEASAVAAGIDGSFRYSEYRRSLEIISVMIAIFMPQRAPASDVLSLAAALHR